MERSARPAASYNPPVQPAPATRPSPSKSRVGSPNRPIQSTAAETPPASTHGTPASRPARPGSSRSAAPSCRPAWRGPRPASASPMQSGSPLRVVLLVLSSQPSSRRFQSQSFRVQSSSSSVARLATRQLLWIADVILRGQVLAQLHLVRELLIARRHCDPQRRHVARCRPVRLGIHLQERHLWPLARRIGRRAAHVLRRRSAFNRARTPNRLVV